MPETNEEDPNSGFSRERFLNAVNASKVKLNKKIINCQEREAKINNTSEPVAKVANDDEKYQIWWAVYQIQRSCSGLPHMG